ncbi:Protein TolB [compost metagenome]
MGGDAPAVCTMACRWGRLLAAAIFLGIGAAACTTPAAIPSGDAAVVSPIRLGIGSFYGDAETANLFVEVLRADLRRGGTSIGTFDASGAKLGAFDMPDWASWRARGASAAIGGRVEIRPDGRLLAQVRIWDVVARQELGGLQFDQPVEDRRLVAHAIANFAQEKLTGVKGSFLDRRIKISLKGTRYVMSISDSDGANEQAALSSPKPLLMPLWLPDRKFLTYVSLETSTPTVWLQEAASGMREPAAAAMQLVKACPSEAALFVPLPIQTPPEQLLEEGWEKHAGAACKARLLALANQAEAALARRRLGLPARPAVKADSELSWAERVAKAIRPNIVFDVSLLTGNPAVDINAQLAPDGRVLGAIVEKPSGFPDWDAAALRGVLKTERLPLDVNGRVPPVFVLRMRPLH